jgi:hypothetical protein
MRCECDTKVVCVIAAARSTGLRPFPLQQFGTLSELSALKIFFGSLGQDAFYSDGQLEGEVETAAEHSKIVLRPIDHAEAQVVGPTDVSRDSAFETGSELAEHFGFATEVIRLRMDGERVRRPLCVNDISFAAAEDRTDTRPCIGRKTCARNRIAQRKCS